MYNFIRVLPDVIFPRRCPFCDDVLPFGGKLICAGCEETLQYVGEDHCLRCGRHLTEKTSEYCASCAKAAHMFDRGRSLFVYNDKVRHSIAKFKYKNRREYADYFSTELYKRFRRYIMSERPDALVPVPVSRQRKRRRGYNQAELLAQKLGDLCGIPVRKDVLARVKDTKAMKELNRRERQKNLKNAFKITGNVVKLKTIMVIDDIFTTGSTMDEISAVFKSAGVEKVDFLTVASTAML